MMELSGRPVTSTELGALGLYNYGHFTSMRVENLRVRGLSLHLGRLSHDCEILHGVNLDPDRIRHLVRRVVTPAATIVRVTVFDPDLDLGQPGADAEPHVLVTTRLATAANLPPLRLRSVHYERDLPEVKHVGLFGSVYQRRAAQLEGFDDVLFVDRESRVSEGPTWNVAFLDGSKIVWSEAAHLKGVTMRLLNDTMRRSGIEHTISTVNIDHVAEMRAAFVTNAAIGLRAVQSIDDVDLSSGSALFDLLRKKYADLPGEIL